MKSLALHICASLPVGPSPFLCRVHSVFTHTVNLITPDELLIPLLPREMGPAVGAITLADNTVPALQKGDTVDIAPLLSAPRCDHTLHPMEFLSYQMPYILEQVPSVFRGDHPLSPMILPKAETFFCDPCPATAREILGLGIGLTPSCDDLLIGWMAMETALGQCRQLLQSEDLRATTAVSRLYLGHAMAGRFSPAVRRCAAAMMGCGDPDVFAQLVTFGHTSGADTLWGMQMCMEKLQKV